MLGFPAASFTDKHIFPFTPSLILAFSSRNPVIWHYFSSVSSSLFCWRMVESKGSKDSQTFNIPLFRRICFVLLFACFSTESCFPALLTLREKVWVEIVLKRASPQYLWSEASCPQADGKLLFRGNRFWDSHCRIHQDFAFFALCAVQTGTEEQTLLWKPYLSSLPI